MINDYDKIAQAVFIKPDDEWASLSQSNFVEADQFDSMVADDYLFLWFELIIWFTW